MNNAQNEKQLIPIKKIIIYTVIIGLILMGIALATGVFTVGTDYDDTRFGKVENSIENTDE
ncbi:hypothetical protein [Jiulongibacter sp. NS-SX5]|uniref:hypothetical protein n=1 Tax=Jiulongibacter sp. NS-SX5 TaxID=3463854 RepID=UPI0040590749